MNKIFLVISLFLIACVSRDKNEYCSNNKSDLFSFIISRICEPKSAFVNGFVNDSLNRSYIAQDDINKYLDKTERFDSIYLKSISLPNDFPEIKSDIGREKISLDSFNLISQPSNFDLMRHRTRKYGLYSFSVPFKISKDTYYILVRRHGIDAGRYSFIIQYKDGCWQEVESEILTLS